MGHLAYFDSPSVCHVRYCCLTVPGMLAYVCMGLCVPSLGPLGSVSLDRLTGHVMIWGDLARIERRFPQKMISCLSVRLSTLSVSICLSVLIFSCLTVRLSLGLPVCLCMAASFLYLPCCLCTYCCLSIPVSVGLFFCVSVPLALHVVCSRMSVLISLWLHSSASLYTSIFQLVRRPSSSGGPVTGCSYSASSGHSRPIRPDHLPITHTKTTEPYMSCLAVSAPPSALRGCVWWRDARRHATAACLSNEPRQRNPQIVTFHGIMQLEICW